MLDPSCVAITGPYGSGKSSVIEEMAGILEEASLSYAALDIDWLHWFHAEGIPEDAYREVLMANLTAVVDNYRAVGIERYLAAWAIKNKVDANALRHALSMPLRIVRLTVPIEVIRERLAPSATSDRRRDLRLAETWVAEGTGSDIGDIEVDNDRPIADVARDILAWLGWL